MSSGVKTHRMFCTYGIGSYTQHDGNVSEVICEDACIRDSANLYVRFFLKPQGKFHDENMQNISFNYIDVLTARLISQNQQPLLRFLLAFTIKQYFYKQYFCWSINIYFETDLS